MSLPQNQSLDLTFQVPFLHRLRLTQDTFGRDQSVLLDLLEASGDVVPRVQFWVDESIADAQPQLITKIKQFSDSHADRFEQVGNIQIAPGGEVVKNEIHILERILKCINTANLDRRSYIVVIGGGAVLDAVGFAAGIAHRGIRLIRLPATVLAQADSGVGVKNSVNLFGKKNWLGTFAVPWGVINDESLLSTLPDRDYRCGFSEAVKVSLLKDPAEFCRIEKHAHEIRDRKMDIARDVIFHSAKLHLDHITRGGDPFEALEARPLDFGHWSAHKLEQLTNFELRHGEAVAIGVAIDSVYSSFVHGLPEGDAQRVINCLLNLGMNLSHPALNDTAPLFEGLEEFRQHLGGRLTVTMLSRIGSKLDVHEVQQDVMERAIRYVNEYAAEQTPKPAISRSLK